MSELKDQLQRTLGDNYSLERELGGGGMSRVFLAEETSLGRKVVVKVLPPELAAAVNLERFRREIQLAARLQNPHIVPVLSAGVSDGLPYYTMPFIEGESLRARLAKRGELPVHEAAKILRDVLSALSYAHEHGVVHRDIKPDNILLTGPHAVVADFGVAKALSASTNPGSSLTSLGVALGTPAYMAPEQAAADPTTDHRADIYAVGAVAYEMLTGQQVFTSRSPQAMMAAHAMEAPEPLQRKRASVPAPLASLIMRSLEKRAADRPQSAGDMLAELEASITPSGATTPHTGTMPAQAIKSSSRSTWMAIGGAAILLLLASSSWYWYGHKQPAAGVVATADSTGGATGAIESVAVIPFVNTGGNQSDEYFSDGMTDELAHALSRLPQIRVAGRSSSYAFKGKTASAQEIGKTLDVAAVIEGSIRRAGDRLRVIAQLTSAKNGRVLWSDSYESKAKDVFQIQDEFTKAILGALAPTLAGGTAATVASSARGTTNQDAYDLYLKGRFYFLKRGEANLRHAIDYFDQALALDRKFARAHAGESMVYGVIFSYTNLISPDSAAAMALEAARDAVADDSALGDAHLALANALSLKSNLNDAEREFQLALRIQPLDATTHQWHGDNLASMGDVRAGIAELKRARELDPLSAIIASDLQAVRSLDRDYAASIRTGKEGLQIDSTLAAVTLNLAPEYVLTGHPDSAIAMYLRAFAREPNLAGGRGPLAFAYAAAGRWSEADQIRREALRPGNKESTDLDRIFAHLAFSDWKGALGTFLSLTKGGLYGGFYGCDPIYDPLKRFPEFNARLAQFGARACPARGEYPVRPPPPNLTVPQ